MPALRVSWPRRETTGRAPETGNRAGFPSRNTETTGRFANTGVVPTISRFFGITITMYFDDHGYPHFHAWHADGTAKIRIDAIEVIEGDLRTRQLRLVLARAELHQAELLDNWRRARFGGTLNEIEPLQ